jgi:uncharacterized membrane protein YhhN
VTTAATAALAVALCLAVADWFVVARGNRRVEYFLKPAVLAALLIAALALDPVLEVQRRWLVLALVLSLAGDVFLVLPGDRFVAGLASFLAAHLAYVAAFASGGLSSVPTMVAAIGLLIVIAVLLTRLLPAVSARNPSLRAPVVAYGLVIGAMAATAVGTGRPLAIIGALFFVTSDALLAWNRFVRALPTGRTGVMVTYHLAQACLVLAVGNIK